MSKKKERSALETAPLTGPRYGVMIFGADQSHLDKVRAHMPLIGQVTCNVSRDFYRKERLGPDSGYVDWAVECVLRALTSRFDVLVLLTGGTSDLDETLVSRTHEIARRLEAAQVPRNAGRIVGFCYDLEWENENFSARGWKGYVDSVANALIVLQKDFPHIYRFGPGGTHSDDRTLPDLLTRLEQLGAKFTHATYHAYSDKGWGKWDKRAANLKRLFRDFGYEYVSITECGVTGEDRWGDNRRGDPEVLTYERWAYDLKPRLDSMPHILLRQIYQYTEGGDVEEHGQDFGMFKQDGTPKTVTDLWKPQQ